MNCKRKVADFSLRETIRKLTKINPQISLVHQKKFPKPRERLLSFYQHRRRKVRIEKGGIQGGLPRLIWALIDFSFVRSLVADAYSEEGGNAYDPVSLFLLDLFKYILGCTTKEFCAKLRDKLNGTSYRYYAGINSLHIPCEADFSNFRVRIGEKRYNQIFHVLVEIVHLLGFLSFDIIAIDGTLFPTNSRYKGCNRFCKDCRAIPVDKLLRRLKNKILYRLKDPSKIKLGQEISITVACPSKKFPKNEKKPRIEVLVFSLQAKGPDDFSDNIVKLLGIEDKLSQLGLCLKVIRSNINLIKVESKKQIYTIRCPRLPSDEEARIGVRRDKRDPNKEEKIFGYDAIFITCVEPDLHLEIPVVCLTISGNADEGSQFIPLMEQLKKYHPNAHPKIDLADSKYDILKNYIYARWNRQIPLFDYNVRNEKLSPEALRERGYNENGWPIGPCGCTLKPNGYDQKDGSLCFACFKQCDRCPALREKMPFCRYYEENKLGSTKHMKIKDHPRLLLEIPRGTSRYKKIKSLRPASERINSSAKDTDNGVLSHPKVRGDKRASILTQIAGIVILLKRIFGFIVRTSLKIRKLFAGNDKELYKELFPVSYTHLTLPTICSV